VAALLEVRDLSVGITKGSKHLRPVNGIDITINAGEIVALAGESGSGKTLTALSIMRLLPPAAAITGGSIRCDGDTTSAGIAMIFQESRQSLNPLMKVGAQIAEALELHGIDKKTAAESALNMLRTLKLPESEKIFSAWPHQLSGGMCQRVMIAIAAIRRPRLLIADEPSSSLDTENRGTILDLLAQINREYGTAILFITHDLSVAVDFCSRLLVMYAGRIIEEGPSRELFSAPMHPYTAALVGAIPRKENRGHPLASIPGTAPSIEDRLSGCPFAPRCPKAQSRCTDELPPLESVGEGRGVRCFFP
jgi:peptide/nickel transport system ATP-binding protein